MSARLWALGVVAGKGAAWGECLRCCVQKHAPGNTLFERGFDNFVFLTEHGLGSKSIKWWASHFNASMRVLPAAELQSYSSLSRNNPVGGTIFDTILQVGRLGEELDFGRVGEMSRLSTVVG